MCWQFIEDKIFIDSPWSYGKKAYSANLCALSQNSVRIHKILSSTHNHDVTCYNFKQYMSANFKTLYKM